jgi:hypothetical protein
MVAIGLPTLSADIWRDSDREINRLFSRPANREAVIVIRGADPLVTSPEDVRFRYLEARIAAHRGVVILETSAEVVATANFTLLDAKPIAIE